MHQYSLHANAAPNFSRDLDIFENIAHYENYCNGILLIQDGAPFAAKESMTATALTTCKANAPRAPAPADCPRGRSMAVHPNKEAR
jgi:hypothetical protein